MIFLLILLNGPNKLIEPILTIISAHLIRIVNLPGCVIIRMSIKVY